MRELLMKYRSNNYNYSCSEATIHAANDKYRLNLDEKTMSMMAGFSGGMFVKDLCGINVASISVLSYILTDGVAHQSPNLKQAVMEYLDEYRKLFGSTNCKTLQETYRKDVGGCNDLIFESGKILENIIEKYTNQ